MMNITINSISFNYEEEMGYGELVSVSINYRGRTEDYNHNLNGVLNINAETFYTNSRPENLEKLVREYLIDLLTKK